MPPKEKAKKKKSPPKTPSTPKLPIKGRLDKAGRRWYTDDERNAALAAVVANGGNVQGTAKILGIPMATLSAWHNGHRYPQALQLRNEKNGNLALACEEIAWLLADHIPSKISQAPLNHLTTAFGTLIDKMRLLRGEPTSYGRTETTVNTDIDPARLTPQQRAAFYLLLSLARGEGPSNDEQPITLAESPIPPATEAPNGSGGESTAGAGGSPPVSRKVAAVLS